MANWPLFSPNLNPIEHVRRALKHELYRLYTNTYELKDNTDNVENFQSRIKEAWECIDQAHVQRLVASIPVRHDSCLDAWGWYKKYLLGALQLLNILLFFLVCITYAR